MKGKLYHRNMPDSIKYFSKPLFPSDREVSSKPLSLWELVFAHT